MLSGRVNDIISRPSGITPNRNDYKISFFICTRFTRKAVDCILHQLPCLGGVGDGGDEQTLQQTYSRVSGSARCVQNFDDSLDIAIRMTYRISLRSSSLWEPRHPLLKVLISFHRKKTKSYQCHDEFQSECLVYHTCKQADFRRI